MSTMEIAAYVNFFVALVAMTLYLRNAIRCKSTWRFLKYAFAFNIAIGAFIYALILMHVTYNPALIVRLNTTLLYILFIISGILGRSKYGNRF